MNVSAERPQPLCVIILNYTCYGMSTEVKRCECLFSRPVYGNHLKGAAVDEDVDGVFLTPEKPNQTENDK